MIVIPMAGRSSRFFDAGYNEPKYMLKAHGRSLFNHSVKSFEKYFALERFIFITNAEFNASSFVAVECVSLGIVDYVIVELEEPTRGQAETVYLGLSKNNLTVDEHLVIFNIDTIRPGLDLVAIRDHKSSSGYLETFIGSGANWSNILPKDTRVQTVALVAEKQEISKYCCTGLYVWKSYIEFIRVFEKLRDQNISIGSEENELYVAPMYNVLIAEGQEVHYTIVDVHDVVFAGVPAEYEDFKVDRGSSDDRDI